MTDSASSRPRTTVYLGTSLDGFIARKDGDVAWLDQVAPIEGEDYGWAEFIAGIDVLLMGRNTYEFVEGYDGDWPYPVPVVVLSRSRNDVPERLADKVRFTRGSPSVVLAELAAEGFQHVYVDGGQVVQDFLRAGLIDKLVLTRLPVLLGEGISLFGPLDADLWLDHVETRSWANGMVRSTYVVKHNAKPVDDR